MRHIDNLRTKDIPIQLHWIPAHTKIKENEETDVATKEAIGQKRTKKKNGKWKEWDSGYTAEKYSIKKARATIKLASKKKPLSFWEKPSQMKRPVESYMRSA